MGYDISFHNHNHPCCRGKFNHHGRKTFRTKTDYVQGVMGQVCLSRLSTHYGMHKRHQVEKSRCIYRY